MLSIAALTLALTHAAPNLDPKVAERAAESISCQYELPARMLVVSMAERSSAKRLWLFDTRDAGHIRLLSNARVAHGFGSDPKNSGQAIEFGNALNSNRTSLGLYRIGGTFVAEDGRPGYALDGLDAGWNDRAAARHVVIHPSDYVTDAGGAIGLSAGCPAVSKPTFAAFQKARIEGGYLWIDGGSDADMPSRSCASAVAWRTSQDLSRFASNFSVSLGAPSWAF